MFNSFSANDDYTVNIILAGHMLSTDRLFVSLWGNYLFCTKSVNTIHRACTYKYAKFIATNVKTANCSKHIILYV